jgi:hypothetical protein
VVKVIGQGASSVSGPHAVPTTSTAAMAVSLAIRGVLMMPLPWSIV